MLKDHAGGQDEQLAILYQKAQQCDQLEEEVELAHQHAIKCSKEVEVREGKRQETLMEYKLCCILGLAPRIRLT